MTKILERALAQVASLPPATQDRIGEELLAYLEKLQGLRAELAAGLRSLDEGAGRELDIDDLIQRAKDRARRSNGG
jgi:hypothetical protein